MVVSELCPSLSGNSRHKLTCFNLTRAGKAHLKCDIRHFQNTWTLKVSIPEAKATVNNTLRDLNDVYINSWSGPLNVSDLHSAAGLKSVLSVLILQNQNKHSSKVDLFTMACCNLQLRRSLIILVSLLMLSSAADSQQHKQPESESSQGSHDVFNRTVVLNSASERYLAMIFHDYSDNTTGKISAARFKDLLRDLSLGEKVLKTKASSLPHQYSEGHHHRNSRSYDEQEGAFGEFGGRFSEQRSRQKRRSTEPSKLQTKLVSHGSPARSRDRKRRNMEDLRFSLDERNVVSYSIKTGIVFRVERC